MSIKVTIENFVRAETDRMFADLQRDAGGINAFRHNRLPADVAEQTVVRLNRDTLYSFAVVDLADGVTLTLPDAGERYVSAMVVSRDHFVTHVFHGAGDHTVTADGVGSDYAVLAVRTLADPNDEDDLAAVAALQDQYVLAAGSARTFEYPDYDPASMDATRDALLQLARGMSSTDGAFGRRGEVDPVRHLLGTAAGWGGLPSSEASYLVLDPEPGTTRAELTMRDVPVDGFWSISVYDAKGFFVPNDRDAYSINNITAAPNEDGSVTARFGDFPDGTPNVIPAPEGWNLLVRLYRPRAAVLEGQWTLPALQLPVPS